MCPYLWCVVIKWVNTLSTVFEQLSSFSDVCCQPSWVLLITLLGLLTLLIIPLKSVNMVLSLHGASGSHLIKKNDADKVWRCMVL
jgi:hypothetical protein